MMRFKAALSWEWYNPTGNEGDDGYDPDAKLVFDGEVPEFNQKNFMRVIKKHPWIGEQINEQLEDRKAFFDNSKSD
jgi:hypothetical protein